MYLQFAQIVYPWTIVLKIFCQSNGKISKASSTICSKFKIFIIVCVNAFENVKTCTRLSWQINWEIEHEMHSNCHFSRNLGIWNAFWWFWLRLYGKMTLISLFVLAMERKTIYDHLIEFWTWIWVRTKDWMENHHKSTLVTFITM